MISATESSNEFQKTTFWKEKSVENMVTLQSTTQVTVVLMMHKLEWIDVGGHLLFLYPNVRCVITSENVWSMCIPSLAGLFMVWVHK